jgi:hypothetical protein
MAADRPKKAAEHEAAEFREFDRCSQAISCQASQFFLQIPSAGYKNQHKHEKKQNEPRIGQEQGYGEQRPEREYDVPASK